MNAQSKKSATPSGANSAPAKKQARDILPNELVEDLLIAALPAEPIPEKNAQLKTALLARATGAAEVTIKGAVDAGPAAWNRVTDQIEIRVLSDNGVASARLVRFAPGGVSRGHTHRYDEGALVVEGACSVGSHELVAGDYHFVPAGQSHGDIVSKLGCILFVHGPSLRSGAHNDTRHDTRHQKGKESRRATSP
jgi:quercetin dioxygenase-like cupin family protein